MRLWGSSLSSALDKRSASVATDASLRQLELGEIELVHAGPEGIVRRVGLGEPPQRHERVVAPVERQVVQVLRQPRRVFLEERRGGLIRAAGAAGLLVP